MKYFKTIIICLVIILSLFLYSTLNSFSRSPDVIWTEGDTILTLSVCKDEETILKVAYADTKSSEAVIDLLTNLVLLNECISVPSPLMFYIHSVISTYKDFKNEHSSILALSLISSPEIIVGYSIAMGKPSTKKNNSY